MVSPGCGLVATNVTAPERRRDHDRSGNRHPGWGPPRPSQTNRLLERHPGWGPRRLSQAEERLRELAVAALPEVEWQTASGEEDILLYRERTNLPLSELPQLGDVPQDAYRQMSAAEHFTPHCRSDVDFSKGDFV